GPGPPQAWRRLPAGSNSRTGGAGTQQRELGSSVSVRGRWSTQTWSCASTATPDAWPMSHRFGRGLGHAGSTRSWGTRPSAPGWALAANGRIDAPSPTSASAVYGYASASSTDG